MNFGSKMAGDRLDTMELKLQIETRLGRQKTEQYFNLLNKYLNLKITKPDFDKLCIGLLGKEAVTFHNKLIRAIISNAHLSKSPPPMHENGKISVNANKYRTTPPKYQEQQSAELLSLGSRPPVEVTSVEEGEEIEQSPGIYSRSPLRAPIGVTLKAKAKKEMLPSPFLDVETCYKNGELPDTSSLRKRLEQKLETEGFNVSTDYVNLLNNGLDVFMKRLLKPCFDLSSSKKVFNHVYHKATSYTNGVKSISFVSLTDFGVSIESNPQILGEDWPELLEKVSCASEEYYDHRVGVHQNM